MLFVSLYFYKDTYLIYKFYNLLSKSSYCKNAVFLVLQQPIIQRCGVSTMERSPGLMSDIIPCFLTQEFWDGKSGGE